MKCSLVPLVLVAVLGIAACGSDGPSDSLTTSTVSGDVSTTADSAGSATSTKPTTPTSPPAPGTSAVGSTPSTPAAPLTEPSVSMYEVGSFDQPVDIATRPGDATLYVIEQPGRVLAVTDLSSEPVLDITDLTDANSEQGLLGLAFHPTADLAYVDFTDLDGNTVVAEFTIEADTGLFDRDSYREVLTVDQPYSNHNGGKLAFGPDQLLYIGLGDGGSGGDPDRHALDLSSRLGKILRIDPVASGDDAFTVPDDNPFVSDDSADPTIWAYGLRNPWRFSFDPETGDLWIADVGQGDIEEIDHAPATDRRNAGRGANFGWSAFEGNDRFNADQTADDAVAPVYTYEHDDGRCSVSGGAIARGSAVPDLAGWFVFGDYCTGQIWALDPSASADDPRVVQIAELSGLAAITEGPDRDLFAISNAGTISRFIPA